MKRLFDQVSDPLLSKALEELLIEMPSFISDMLANLHVEERDTDNVYVACITNKNEIIINTKNINNIAQRLNIQVTTDLYKVIYIHELMHYKLRHFERLTQEKDKELVNICLDVEIHNLFYNLKHKFYDLVSSFEGVTFEKLNKSIGKELISPEDTAEEIYEKLMTIKRKNPSKGKGEGNSNSNDNGDSNESEWENSDDREESSFIDEIKKDAGKSLDNLSELLEKTPEEVKIKSTSFKPGNVSKEILGRSNKEPGSEALGMLRKIEGKLVKVYVPDIRNLLKRITENFGYTSRSFAYPNKIGMTNASILPGNHNVHVEGKILVGIDTSGSVGEEELEKVYSFINELYKLGNFQIKIAYCDTQLYEGETIKSKTDLKKELKPKGNGGTELNPIIEYSNKNKYDFLFVLTDGYIYSRLKPSKAKRIIMLYNKKDSSTEQLKGERYYYLTDK